MPPRFRDLKDYCDEHFVLVRNTDHWHYELVLADGTVLRTKVSHALLEEIPPRQWEKILRYQLCISEKEFWDSL
jgi:hypothetical protein